MNDFRKWVKSKKQNSSSEKIQNENYSLTNSEWKLSKTESIQKWKWFLEVSVKRIFKTWNFRVIDF